MGAAEAPPAKVLVFGAHPDDIEIGCGGTMLKLIEEGSVDEICWVVLSGESERGRRGGGERQRAARRRTSRSASSSATSATASFPTTAARSRASSRGSRREFSPDVVFTHQRKDLHQDHRVGLRADLEHVPRPPDPRVRGPEVRRRHGLAEPVRAARGRPLPAEGRPPARPLRTPSARSAGSRRTCSRACCGCAGWSASRRRPTPRPSTAARRSWHEPGNRPTRQRRS